MEKELLEIILYKVPLLSLLILFFFARVNVNIFYSQSAITTVFKQVNEETYTKKNGKKETNVRVRVLI